jgi:NPCBM/NEW2 domain-containing protein
MTDEVDSNRSRWPIVLTVLGAIANVAQVAALFLAPGLEWLAVAGVGAFVAGLIASIIAWKRRQVVVALLAVVVLVLGASLLAYTLANREDGVTAQPSPTGQPPASTAVAVTPGGSASPSPSPSPDTTATTGSTEGWYELTAYRSVAFGNGHDSVDSITIGTESYPSSIRGTYPSSAANQNNFRTWLVGGKCTQLSVWVGKDQASPRSAGTGRFIVKNGDLEMRTAEASMDDAPQHLEVDITGVSRLTLLDTRQRLDADNAWGNPRVQCTEPPGEAR